MTFMRMQNDLQKPKLGDHMFTATVVDNNDPRKIGRCQVRIKEIHGTSEEVPDSHLPWAAQIRPSSMGSSNNQGHLNIPRVGSQVVVFHHRGDVYSPSYFGDLSYNGSELTEQSDADYPNIHGFRDSDGNSWIVNMIDNTLNVVFNGSKTVSITGSRTDTIDGDQTENIGGDLAINVDGNLSLTTPGTLTLDADTVYLTASAFQQVKKS